MVDTERPLVMEKAVPPGDDMFAEDDAFERQHQGLAGGGVEGLAPQAAAAAAEGLVDGWDDVEGYYQVRRPNVPSLPGRIVAPRE